MAVGVVAHEVTRMAHQQVELQQHGGVVRRVNPRLQQSRGMVNDVFGYVAVSGFGRNSQECVPPSQLAIGLRQCADLNPYRRTRRATSK